VIRSASTSRLRTTSTVAAILCAGMTAGVRAQFNSAQTPPEMEGVGITDRRGEAVPLDLEFTDDTGRTVRLAEYFEPGKPVILTLNYYRCPMLCNLILNGLVDGLNGLDWSVGEEFTLLTVSFDPTEKSELAEVKKRAYLTQYTRPSARDGWHFLVGSAESVDALTEAVGYGLRYDEKTGEYAHPSTIIFLTPKGVISLYMDDVMYEPRDLRLALVEASQGAIGSPLDQIALFVCFQYDPESNSYQPVAWKIMRSGGLLTLLTLASGLGFLWYRDLRQRHLSDHHHHPVDVNDS
jgi:protein SCO1/2